MRYPADWSIILAVLLKNRKIGFRLEMDFCLRCRLNIFRSSSGQRRYWSNITQKYGFLSFSGQAIAKKMLS